MAAWRSREDPRAFGRWIPDAPGAEDSVSGLRAKMGEGFSTSAGAVRGQGFWV